MSIVACSVDECERGSVSRGFCDKHYRRWKKRGDPTITTPALRGDCSIDGCYGAHSARGFCPAHYQAWLRKNGGRISDHAPCSVDNCAKVRTHALYCRSHYQFSRKYGDPLYEAPPTPTSKTCTACNETFPLDSFDRRKDRGGMGVMSRCKPCSRRRVQEAHHSNREAYNAYQRKWASENRDKRSAVEAVQRARRLGVDAQKVDRLEIFERDGWVCQMCFEPVDKTLKFPHPMSATWDHIMPVSKGGAHSPENLRLAHWHENKAKGAKVA